MRSIAKLTIVLILLFNCYPWDAAKAETPPRILETDGRFALINMGEKDGLHEGSILEAYRLIGQKYWPVGKVEVIILRQTVSGVRALPGDPVRLEVDDLLKLLPSLPDAPLGGAVDISADFVSRYIWRGLNPGDAPSLQPSISLVSGGFGIGAWAAYSITDNTGSDEIDFWLSYQMELKGSVSLTAILTDYYFPNAGIKLFNFNQHDAPRGPGAHVLEAGLGISGPPGIPISLFGYVNIHNDAGNNAYLELSLASSLQGTALDFFIGATPGSKTNPDYYGPSDLAIINLGMRATRTIHVSDRFQLPVFVSAIVNPSVEVAFVVFGIGL